MLKIAIMIFANFFMFDKKTVVYNPINIELNNIYPLIFTNKSVILMYQFKKTFVR